MSISLMVASIFYLHAVECKVTDLSQQEIEFTANFYTNPDSKDKPFVASISGADSKYLTDYQFSFEDLVLSGHGDQNSKFGELISLELHPAVVNEGESSLLGNFEFAMIFWRVHKTSWLKKVHAVGFCSKQTKPDPLPLAPESIRPLPSPEVLVVNP